MRIRKRAWGALGLLVVAVALVGTPYVRAAAFLRRFSSEPLVTPDVEELPATVRVGGADVPARLYRPRGSGRTGGIVLLHGIHRLGIEEPRLIRFSRTLAESGVTVLTPQISELADYQVSPRSIETIGAAVHTLAATLHAPKVGLMGLSFAGGLALLAASDPRFSPEVGFVVAVGAHDDLARVSRFFATDRAERPDGTTEALRAHEYGRLVLVYNHLGEFFSAEDVPIARDSIRLWLWEQRDQARSREQGASEAGRARLELLFSGATGGLRDALLASIANDEAAMWAVSPAGHLAGLRAPVLLLHGAGDTVIPATETLWLAREVPARLRDQVLISPLLQHVELNGKPSFWDEWNLVRFVAHLLWQM